MCVVIPFHLERKTGLKKYIIKNRFGLAYVHNKQIENSEKCSGGIIQYNMKLRGDGKKNYYFIPFR